MPQIRNKCNFESNSDLHIFHSSLLINFQTFTPYKDYLRKQRTTSSLQSKRIQYEINKEMSSNAKSVKPDRMYLRVLRTEVMNPLPTLAERLRSSAEAPDDLKASPPFIF